LALALFGDPVLRLPARGIPEAAFGSPELVTLVKETLALLDTFPSGVGLAGPQAGVPYRYFVTSCDGLRVALFNPILVDPDPSAPRALGPEGCLSLPHWGGLVDRQINLSVRGRNVRGRWLTFSGHHLTARLFAHEMDHLDAHLYTDWAIPGSLRADPEPPELEETVEPDPTIGP